jgi:hypothetical protein
MGGPGGTDTVVSRVARNTKPVKPISNDAPEPHTLQATALVNEAYLKMAAIGGSEVRVRRWLAGGEEP